MSRSETDREIIERSESKSLGLIEELGLMALTGGLSVAATPLDKHQTTITDKDSRVSVTGSGATREEADRNAWDRLESERRR